MRRTMAMLFAGMLLVIGGCAAATTGSATPAVTSAVSPSVGATSAPTATSSRPAPPSAVPSASPSMPSAPPPMSSQMAEVTQTPTTVEPPSGTTIATGSSQFGQILFDGARQAIYLFDKEVTSTPACYDDCAAAWPPVLTTGAPVPADGIDASLLGTTGRSDGTTQVTYGGHPLYYYAHEDPGEVTCHDVREYGGLWLVVTPQGSAAPS